MYTRALLRPALFDRAHLYTAIAGARLPSLLVPVKRLGPKSLSGHQPAAGRRPLVNLKCFLWARRLPAVLGAASTVCITQYCLVFPHASVSPLEASTLLLRDARNWVQRACEMVALLDPRRPLALGLGYLKEAEHWPELLWCRAWEK